MKLRACAAALVLAGPVYAAPGTAAFYLVGEPVSTVAAALHDFSGVPIFVSPEVSARRISFYSAEPISPKQALVMLGQVVRDSGIRFVSDKGDARFAVHIGRQSAEASAFPVVPVGGRRMLEAAERDFLAFRLQYAVAGEVEPLIERLLGSASAKAAVPPAVIGIDARSNTVYVRADDVEGARLAQRVIAQIDRPGEHPADTSLLYLRHADATRVMNALRALSPRAGEPGAGLSKVEASGGNTLLLTAPAPLRRSLMTLAEALDVPTARVGIEVRVSAVTGTAADGKAAAAGTAAQLLAAASVSVEDSEEARLDLSLPAAQNAPCPLPADLRNTHLRVILRPRVIDGGRVRVAVRIESGQGKEALPSAAADVLETSVVATHGEEIAVIGIAQTFPAGLAASVCAASLPPRRLLVSLRPLLEEIRERGIEQPFLETSPLPVRFFPERGLLRSALTEQHLTLAPRCASDHRNGAPNAGDCVDTRLDDTLLQLKMSADLDLPTPSPSWRDVLWASLRGWIGGAPEAAQEQETASNGDLGDAPPARQDRRDDTHRAMRPALLLADFRRPD